jgi:N-acetylglucosamine-6-phosphate deacetylase
MKYFIGDEIPAIRAGAIITPEVKLFDRVIIIEEGFIAEIIKPEEMPQELAARLLDFREKIIVPGYIDIHRFGAYGYDVSDVSDLTILCQEILPQQGITAVLPAIANPKAEILKSLTDYIERQNLGNSFGTRVLGLHLEGPYLCLERGGCLKTFVRKPVLREIGQWLLDAKGYVKMVTIAPEIEGAEKVMRFLQEQEVLVSWGHSNITYQEAKNIGDLGNAVTHWLNGMPALEKRMEDSGLAGATLDIDNLSAMIIADDLHWRLNPFLHLLIARKGVNHIILVTDAAPPAGLPPNEEGYISIGGQRVRVTEDGRIVQWADPNTLAGSALSMDLAVRKVIEIGIDDRAAIAMATRNPAMLLNRKDIGMIAPGKRADFTVLNSNFSVFATIVGSRLSYIAE